MAPKKITTDATPIHVRPTAADLTGLKVIEAELKRRDRGAVNSRTRALRWAIRELAQRILAGGALLAAGPMSDPPEG